MGHELKLWKWPSDYMGPDWSAYLVSELGQNRDSSIREKSNFECAWESLSALNTDCLECKGDGCDTCCDTGSTVVKVGANHWACGWIEWIAIHPSNEAAVKECLSILGALADYPVLNEEDVGTREEEEMAKAWNVNRERRLRICEDAKVSPINALRSLGNLDDRLREYLHPDRC